MNDAAQNKVSEVSAAAEHHLLSDPISFLDRVSTFAADHVSPLLVKETRQALKSKQFLVTFGLLLMATVVWSFLGVGLGILQEYSESGNMLLLGYCWILSVPLCVIIPYSAFRSLASEFESDTLQLVSITTMTSRSIVAGKMGSAVLQMIVYLSAIVPGVAFSYLLRGVDLTQIAWVLLVAIFSSLALSATGMALAGLCKQIFLRIVLHLFFLAVSIIATSGYCSFAQEFLDFGHVPAYRIVFYLTIALAVTYFCFETTVSLVSFSADNKSTRIRVAVSVSVFAVLASVFALAAEESGWWVEDYFFPVTQVLVVHFYAIFGLMTAAESPRISQRAQRQFPKSTLGHAITGLYLPGPGRGYLFAVSGIWGWTIGLYVVFVILGKMVFVSFEAATLTFLTNAIFATSYVSLNYLLNYFFHERIPKPAPVVGLLFGVTLHLLILAMSYSLHWLVFSPTPYFDFFLYFTWYGVLYGIERSVGFEIYLALALNFILMSTLALPSLILASRQLVLTGSAVPKKVLEEIAAMKKVRIALAEESMEDIFQQRRQNPSATVAAADNSTQD